MVTILSPNTTMCYQSSPILTCTLEQATDGVGWNLLKTNERTPLSAGNVVKLNSSCATPDYRSCSGLTLQNVTGSWAGKYRRSTEVWQMKECRSVALQRVIETDLLFYD